MLMQASPPARTVQLFDRLREHEFSRLDTQGHVYLDYTGSALYPASLVALHGSSLQASVLGNPHSVNPASAKSAKLIERARQRVLAFFDADPEEYQVIFTANTSAAIKLVAESFPFNTGSRLLLTADNHNSVNGIREYAARAGAKVRYVPMDNSLGLMNLDKILSRENPVTAASLFAYPAQSNFSGVKHSLDYIDWAQSLGYQVLLDAAAFVPGSPLQLSAVRADYVGVSFYKMFGYPTGIGALLARRQALAMLRRPWFAGGTVDFASTQHNIHQLAPREAAFEDGTANFIAAQSVINGLDFLQRIGMPQIRQRLGRLAGELIGAMTQLRHGNGAPLVRCYGDPQLDYGSSRAFNLLNSNGKITSYEAVEQAAEQSNISIRGGCFCNPGCAEAAFGFAAETTRHCMQTLDGHRFSPARFALCLGQSEVGALRVSLGIANNHRDIQRFIAFLTSFIEVSKQ